MPKTRTAYILLFRGVGGATQLPVKPLREALASAGFENVGTYINSGNAWLSTKLSRRAMPYFDASRFSDALRDNA